MYTTVMKKIIWLCLCVFAANADLNLDIDTQWRYDNDIPCMLPNGLTANCISVNKCEKVAKIFKHYTLSSKIIPRNVLGVLQKYQCGYDELIPKFCCPLNKTTNVEVDEGSVDVSNHTNINLINLNNCGISLGSRIIGGTVSQMSEFPWMALISYMGNGGSLNFRCDGSLISSRYVLTAAHCFNVTERIVGVRLGEYLIGNKTDCEISGIDEELICASPVQDILVEKIIAHPGYTVENSFNDIGLIKLAKAADITKENVKPVCLPVGDLQRNNLTSKNVTVTGWGATESGYSSKVLLKVQLPIVDHDDCRERYSELNITITPNQFCAGGVTGKDSCKGDSGGPMGIMGRIQNDVRFIQYGVLSFGPRFCGAANVPPGTYTKVGNYLKWILDQMET